jgi:hypothetical protein
MVGWIEGYDPTQSRRADKCAMSMLLASRFIRDYVDCASSVYVGGGLYRGFCYSPGVKEKVSSGEIGKAVVWHLDTKC